MIRSQAFAGRAHRAADLPMVAEPFIKVTTRCRKDLGAARGGLPGDTGLGQENSPSGIRHQPFTPGKFACSVRVRHTPGRGTLATQTGASWWRLTVGLAPVRTARAGQGPDTITLASPPRSGRLALAHRHRRRAVALQHIVIVGICRTRCRSVDPLCHRRLVRRAQCSARGDGRHSTPLTDPAVRYADPSRTTAARHRRWSSVCRENARSLRAAPADAVSFLGLFCQSCGGSW